MQKKKKTLKDWHVVKVRPPRPVLVTMPKKKRAPVLCRPSTKMTLDNMAFFALSKAAKHDVGRYSEQVASFWSMYNGHLQSLGCIGQPSSPV